ncbi:hypothetical protein ACFQI7_20235 [Paenibacillus allorhizosphaerae]|uniref:Uncharacterized protein n=1 Tax=Paenibacillus allorhizosphaerae TaxID=2849866 RepID=A0ABM8VL22_9BACL|nr:hypothetical protein [Paenibacillus allorhizosphaerae]CAG7647478.1 hypothetical protein PAECIP111802_03984 [Paenibacillus allorhizosphaerae]
MKRCLHYTDALHAALTASGYFHGSKALLSGITANAFRFQTHCRLTADAIHAYNWKAEHWLSADFLGIHNTVWCGFTDSPTFPLYQKAAWDAVANAHRHGRPSILWTGKFTVTDPRHDAPGGADLLYGCPPFWFCQTFGDKLEVRMEELYRESLVQAVYLWERHDSVLPPEQYGCGERAYGFMLQAFRTGDFDRTGAAAVIRWLLELKQNVLAYLQEIESHLPGLGPVIERYDQLTALFRQMEELLRTAIAEEKPNHRKAFQMLADATSEARRIESDAIIRLKEMFREVIGSRYRNIGLR